ncbi:MAG TPA: rod-binding protein, partial [Kofleriaceae bacterium]|nr:rod-binding protein [Kofleriaceae bacterium]
MKTDALAGHAPQVHDPAKSAKSAKTRDGVQVAARQLEAFFLRQMLAESRPQGGGALDGGFAGDTFKQMLDEAIADKMSAAGGIGMATMFAKQLGKADEVAAPPPPPIAGAPLTAVGGPAALDAMAAGAPQLAMPVIGRPSSGYGLRADPVHGGSVNHPGFDLAAPAGTEVAA